MERGEGTDNHPMSAAALVLFAFQGDAITAPPTDFTQSSCDRTARPGDPSLVNASNNCTASPLFSVQRSCAPTDAPRGTGVLPHPTCVRWQNVKTAQIRSVKVSGGWDQSIIARKSRDLPATVARRPTRMAGRRVQGEGQKPTSIEPRKTSVGRRHSIAEYCGYR